MKKFMKVLAAAICICMLSACGNGDSKQNVDGNPSLQSPAPQESEQSPATPAPQETEQPQEMAEPQVTEQSQEPEQPEKDGRCSITADHFSYCSVVPGDGKIQLDFKCDIPSGESNGFYFIYQETQDPEAAPLEEGINCTYDFSGDTTSYTLEDLTNDKTYYLYASAYVEYTDYPNEADRHDYWYIGAYTPTADDTCHNTANHLISYDVTVGDDKIQIDFETDYPSSESNSFYFSLWETPDRAWDYEVGMEDDYYGNTTCTFENLTKGKTYYLYAHADIYVELKESLDHGYLYLGAYTPGGN